MSDFTSRPIARRIADIEEALCVACERGDFEVVTVDGERFLRPILIGYVHDPDYARSIPMLSLYRVARDVERLLS